VIGLESRQADRWGKGAVGISELFRSSLRLRPDRIIIGEVRGGEAMDVIQAMTSGHAGSMTTLHANSALDALSRLETLAMMNKIEMPLHALRAQVASAIDVVVQMNRFNDGRRAITELAEVLPLGDDGRYRLQDVFAFQLAGGVAGKVGKGDLVWTGKKSSFADQPKVRMTREHWDLTNRIFSADA
jgi:pilus assembly protein CpaF